MGNKLARRRTQIDDRFTRPQGLYQHKDVDHKKLRRLIIDSKLAPCYPGGEDAAIDLDECPICFLHYPSLNRSKCCTKGICTECFLQVKSPNSARPTQCPFCKTPNYAVEYRGAKTQEEKGVEQAEEQKVIEAKIRIRRQQEIQDEEARLQRREQAPQEESLPSPPPPQEREQDVSSFPVFSPFGEERPVDQLLAPERSWNAWTNLDSTAIGYPQSDYFTTFPQDSESPWHRGSQRDFGRQQNNSSSSALSARNSSPFNLRRRGGISGEAGQGPGAGFPSLNRDEDFDLDLDDIMVMEAIWLSIQEQGSQRTLENGCETAPLPSPFSALQYEAEDSPLESSEVRGRRGSVTGGFASAIAALAERQVAGSTASEQPSHSDSDSIHSASGVASNAGEAQAEAESVEDQAMVVSGTGSDNIVDHGFLEKDGKVEASETVSTTTMISSAARTVAATTNPATTGLINKMNINNNSRTSSSSGTEATSGVLVDDQGLEVVGAGTSFCRDDVVVNPLELLQSTASAAASEDGREMLPESFEEQMMLAMALSLAEAQPQAKCCLSRA